MTTFFLSCFQLKSPTEESTGTAVGDGEQPPANGSIFTMTLKNNHLIVETEERNVSPQVLITDVKSVFDLLNLRRS